jgi:hypothetical protein
MTLLNLSKYVSQRLYVHKNLNSCTPFINHYMKKYTYTKQTVYYNSIVQQSNIKFNKYGYRHIPLYDLENIKMILLEWSPNSFSPIHDHHDNGCIMLLLKNELMENRYCIHSHKLLKTHYLPLNEVQYIDNEKHLHSIHNKCNSNYSLSLHIYPK